MDDRIKVRVVEFGDRPTFQMQWVDPWTGRKKTKSTGIERTGRRKERTEAERIAAKFEAELREGRYHSPCRVTWQEFRDKYQHDVLPGLARNTELKARYVFNFVERILRPNRLWELTADRISYLQAELRKQNKAEDSIKSYMAHLKAALSKAVDWGMLPKMPKIAMPKRINGAGRSKGRAITTEEFERLVDKVPGIVGTAAAASWVHYLTGLWLSGLRLAESLELTWDREDRLCVDLDGKYPLLRIPAELDKGHQNRDLPMAPEFADFLLATPEAERTGYVFNPLPVSPTACRLTADRVGRVVSAIGEAAGVIVSRDTKTGDVKKYASAHDLRRGFGGRWSHRIMPQDLKELMRHETIETTMTYYVGRNAQATASVLWEAYKAIGNKSGNSDQNSPTLPSTQVYGRGGI